MKIMRMNGIQQIEAQVGTRLFGCVWKRSRCDSAFLSLPRHDDNFPTLDGPTIPLAPYWATELPHYTQRDSMVIKKFMDYFPDSSIKTVYKERVWTVTIQMNERIWQSSDKKKGVAVCLAVLKVIIENKMKKRTAKKSAKQGS